MVGEEEHVYCTKSRNQQLGEEGASVGRVGERCQTLEEMQVKEERVGEALAVPHRGARSERQTVEKRGAGNFGGRAAEVEGRRSRKGCEELQSSDGCGMLCRRICQKNREDKLWNALRKWSSVADGRNKLARRRIS